ncbi:MAG TPA: hypothetical protein VIL95_01785, partial [Bacillota bacterium]
LKHRVNKASSKLSNEERKALAEATRQVRRLLAETDPATAKQEAQKIVRKLRAIANREPVQKALSQLAADALKGASKQDIRRLLHQAVKER